MVDKIDEAAVQRGLAARAEDREHGIDRAKTILTELVDATRTAAETMLDDRKQRAAEQVNVIAEAVRCAAQCFERSDSRAVARYAHRAADQFEDLALRTRNRHWSEIVGDVEDLARRRPTLFMLGATVAGFLAGRLLSLSADRPRTPSRDELEGSDLSPHRGETDEITAAVSRLVTPRPEVR